MAVIPRAKPMALTRDERAMLEAVVAAMTADELGLAGDRKVRTGGAAERGFEQLHNQVNELFALRAAGLTHHTAACQAFGKVHNYKYVNDPDFVHAMDRELASQGVPADERRHAARFVGEIIEELKGESEDWGEQDRSFHPDLDAITAFPDDADDAADEGGDR